MIDLKKVKDFIRDNLISLISILVAIISISTSFFYVYTHKCEECEVCQSITCEDKVIEEETIEPITFKVDIKGAVKKPGVYEVNENSTVSDAITLAGGLTASGVTTNINLAKKLSSEMVVYVFTKSELNKMQSENKIVCEVPKCECESLNVNKDICTNPTNETTNESSTKTEITETSNEIISINTDSIEELMKLDGIGESKAKAIIEYRASNGNFQKIEDIMNVSGIGEKAYEKIKDKIKI